MIFGAPDSGMVVAGLLGLTLIGALLAFVTLGSRLPVAVKRQVETFVFAPVFALLCLALLALHIHDAMQTHDWWPVAWATAMCAYGVYLIVRMVRRSRAPDTGVMP
ncbi:MAG: hypothetical protein JWP35_992 [Caulobacter sp.]|nr:hypothetical protein [Caulobacter sp.]